MPKVIHLEPFGRTNTRAFVETIVSGINSFQTFDCLIATSKKNEYGEPQLEYFGSYGQTNNPLTKLFCYLIGLYKIARHISNDNTIGAVHYHWPKFAPADFLFSLYAQKKQVRVIHTVHNFLPHESKKLDTYFLRKIYSKSDNLILMSQRTISRLKKWNLDSKDNWQIIPHYSYNHLFDDKAENEQKKMVFLFSGNIRPYKGLDVLLEAAHQLATQSTNWGLIITGKKEYDISNLIDKYRDVENISWNLGWQTDEQLSEIYQQSTVLVLPYHKIDSSGMLFYGMSAGKAVIASAIGSLDEHIEHEKNGLKFECGNSADLFKQMLWCVQNPIDCQKLGKAAQSYMDEYFSVEKICRKYLEAYQSFMN